MMTDNAYKIVLDVRKLDMTTGIFLGLIWGRITAPSQFKNEQKPISLFYILVKISWKSDKNTKVTDAWKIA